MRPSLKAACFVLLASATSAAAQERVPPPAVAFPAAVTTSLGFVGFSPRYEQATGTEYSFGSSLVLGLAGDFPLTRRTGLRGEVFVAPLAKQRIESPNFGRSVGEDVLVYAAHLGIAGRLKPAAPVFFQLGGGVTMASKHAFPDADGRPMEPHAGLTIGYEGTTFGRANIRFTYSGRLTSVDAPDVESLDKKSIAFDQVLQLGLRFVPSRVPVRRVGR